MTRFFYSDALAAAWMVKHFGMKLTRTHCHRGDGAFGESMQPIPLWVLARDVENQVSEAVRYYVHPDSLHLLQPKPGDKVSYSFGVGQYAGEAWDEVKGIIAPNDEGYPYTGNGEPYVLVDGCDEFPLSRLKAIFQRDGKPFMWPESEAA